MKVGGVREGAEMRRKKSERRERGREGRSNGTVMRREEEGVDCVHGRSAQRLRKERCQRNLPGVIVSVDLISSLHAVRSTLRSTLCVLRTSRNYKPSWLPT